MSRRTRADNFLSWVRFLAASVPKDPAHPLRAAPGPPGPKGRELTFIRCLTCARPHSRTVSPILVLMRQVAMKPILQALKLAPRRALACPRSHSKEVAGAGPEAAQVFRAKLGTQGWRRGKAGCLLPRGQPDPSPAALSCQVQRLLCGADPERQRVGRQGVCFALTLPSSILAAADWQEPWWQVAPLTPALTAASRCFWKPGQLLSPARFHHTLTPTSSSRWSSPGPSLLPLEHITEGT